MFKTILIYRILQWDPPSVAELAQRLDAARFVECGATQQEAAGWVAPRGEKHAALIESVAGRLIVKLCTETRVVPGTVVRTRLDERLDQIEQDTGRRPKGKPAREIKEEIVHELLPRAFPKRASTLVWVDAAARWVIIEASSVQKSDAVASRLVELLGGGIGLALLQTEIAPSTAMSEWLQTRAAPAGFSIDRECELKQPDSEKASVRYSRHALEIDEVAEHIRQGKIPTQLALTWNSRVSFVLNESMTMRKIKLLDVVIEGAGASREDSGFDADVALSTGELSGLLTDLIEALGGEPQRQPSLASDAGPAPAAALQAA